MTILDIDIHGRRHILEGCYGTFCRRCTFCRRRQNVPKLTARFVASCTFCRRRQNVLLFVCTFCRQTARFVAGDKTCSFSTCFFRVFWATNHAVKFCTFCRRSYNELFDDCENMNKSFRDKSWCTFTFWLVYLIPYLRSHPTSYIPGFFPPLYYNNTIDTPYVDLEWRNQVHVPYSKLITFSVILPFRYAVCAIPPLLLN